MASDWRPIEDYVKSEFEGYLPVPSLMDVDNYRPLNFLIVRNTASNWYGNLMNRIVEPFPKFDFAGNITDFAAAKAPDSSLPDIHVKKIGISGKHARTKTTVEGQIAPLAENIEGSIDTSTSLPSLGVITRHNVNYRDIRAYVGKYCFIRSAEDMISEARRGNLFIIHDVIMAEKLSLKGRSKQSFSSQISSIFKFKYKLSNSLDFERPSEFGYFPVAFKVGRIKACRLKHAAHSSAVTCRSADETQPSSIGYRLKIEPLSDFSRPHSRRNLGKENSPSSSSEDSVSPSSSRVSKRKVADKETGNETSERKARRYLSYKNI